MGQGDAFLVGEGDAQDGHGEEAQFRFQGIGDDVGGQADTEEEGAVQEIGYEVALEELLHGTGEEVAADYADDGYFEEGQGEDGGGIGAVGGEQGLEDQDGEDGADGIDDDTFPAGDGADILGWADMAEQRADDGGAGHDEDGAEEDGEPEVEAGGPMEGTDCEDPGEEDAEGAEPEDGATGFPDFVEAQAESPFQQDSGHRERDEGEHDIGAYEFVGVEEPSGGESEKEEEQDGGELGTPGEPLGCHAEGDDRSER